MPENVQLDPMEALKVILAQLNQNQTEQLKQFAADLKKPTEREQRKLEEEDRRIERQQKERLELAKAEVRRKELNAASCGHIRVHPGTGVVKHLWRAQVSTPAGEEPYFVPTCQSCQTQVGKIRATTTMLTQGVNLDQYTNITYEALKKWAQECPA